MYQWQLPVRDLHALVSSETDLPLLKQLWVQDCHPLELSLEAVKLHMMISMQHMQPLNVMYMVCSQKLDIIITNASKTNPARCTFYMSGAVHITHLIVSSVHGHGYLLSITSNAMIFLCVGAWNECGFANGHGNPQERFFKPTSSITAGSRVARALTMVGGTRWCEARAKFLTTPIISDVYTTLVQDVKLTAVLGSLRRF